MDIEKALRTIDKLNKTQREHLLQRLEYQLVHYKRVIKNYTPDKMTKYGEPYLEKLNDKIRLVQESLL